MLKLKLSSCYTILVLSQEPGLANEWSSSSQPYSLSVLSKWRWIDPVPCNSYDFKIIAKKKWSKQKAERDNLPTHRLLKKTLSSIIPKIKQICLDWQDKLSHISENSA